MSKYRHEMNDLLLDKATQYIIGSCCNPNSIPTMSLFIAGLEAACDILACRIENCEKSLLEAHKALRIITSNGGLSMNGATCADVAKKVLDDCKAKQERTMA